MMFNWFKRPDYTEQTTATDDMMLENENPPETDKESDVPRDDTYDTALYTVGINNAGLTQLTLTGTGYGSITLIMQEPAVRAMIRQLLATLPE